MGRGGHNIKSKEELKANGTYRPAYHANRLEAPVVDEVPPPPADFDKEHADKWKAVCALLKDADILANADIDAVRLYVESVIMAKRNWAILQREGFVVDGKKHPAHLVYESATKMAKALFEQFGFTPRARMGMKVQPKKKETDPVADLLKAMNNTTRNDA